MTSSRQGRFPHSKMPAASNDRSQTSAPFMGTNLYTNSSIWGSANRDRALASRDSDEGSAGPGALNANSEGSVWNSNPWNPDKASRPTSTSPNRTRDNGLTSGSGLLDSHQPSVRSQRSGFVGNGFQDETNGYSSFAAPQRRSPDSSFMDSISGFTPARDNLPPSRQSQGSPAYAELYRGHTPNNSIQSQRPMSMHQASLQHQTANQRAYTNNRQIDEELAYQFARRATLENGAANGTTSFNPASQPFQMNAGTQSWTNQSSSSRLNSVDLGSEQLAAQLQAMRNGSVDRIPAVPNFRIESGNNSPRGYAPNGDSWANRQAPRDSRTAESDRRAPTQQYAPSFQPSYYANAYHQYQVTPQYPLNLVDPYAQNMRQSLIPGYGLPLHPAYTSLNIPIRSPREQDPSKGVRSVLLDEFRQSKSKRYDLKDIYNHMVEFSGDQHGSRFIQQKLESANSDEKDQVFREIEPNAIQLMKDVFGNYVIQKFFEHGSQVQKKVLAERMKNKVVDLSIQVYACRVVQKALEHVLVEQQAELTKELEPEIGRVIKDQNGNHVIQKVIELVPRQHLDFIMTALKGHVTSFSSHTYGCRIIQRMLEHGTEEDKALIMSELHPSIQILLTDQYGNYVTQHVIQHGKVEDRERIIQMVMPQALALSKHKFASNVVEKCIQYGSPEQRSIIREQLTAMASDGSSPLQQLIRDQYGNYVIQKLLVELEGAERELLVEQLKPQYFNLRKVGSSRQLQALEKLLGLGSSSTGKNQDDINSSIPTPVLTNESNSPRSSSPPSTNASAVGAPTSDEMRKASNTNGISPYVQNTEA